MAASPDRLPPETTCPVISRPDMAWVSVATNDTHPLHLDHVYAVQRGYRDAVVPGHMLIGWICEYLEDWAQSPNDVLNWQIRFTAPLWPGDQVTLKGEILERIGADKLKTKVTATTAEGKVAGVATAELRIA